LGVATYKELLDVLRRLVLPAERLFVVHCVLGHQITRLIHLQEALNPKDNYFWLHDYSSLCVGFNLLRNDVSHCGAPSSDSMACRICVYGQDRLPHLSAMEHLFTAISFHVISPSAFTLDLWRKFSSLPHCSRSVQEHCQIEISGSRRIVRSTVPRGRQENPVRVAYIGHPSPHKGWHIFLNLLSKIHRLSAYKFYHFGSEYALQPAYGVEGVAVNVTPEDRNRMVEALIDKEIDIVLVLSPWPETFSYVTYEAFAAGAAVVTLPDSGNVTAIVRKTGWGVIVDEEDLIDFFRDYRAVQLVRKHFSEGISIGSLRHTGTTANLISSTKSTTKAL
jgi:glycosyltransferase involved in cell wall biosynthesis